MLRNKHRLQIVSLRGNELEGDGVAALAPALADAPTLQSLSLTGACGWLCRCLCLSPVSASVLARLVDMCLQIVDSMSVLSRSILVFLCVAVDMHPCQCLCLIAVPVA